MKTTLALLMTGLIFLATPMLASAHGNHHDNGKPQSKCQVNNDRHPNKAHYAHHDDRRNQNHHRHELRETRHELRETRQDLRQAKRQIRYSHPRPHHVPPAVLIGIPHLVFQFDW